MPKQVMEFDSIKARGGSYGPGKKDLIVRFDTLGEFLDYAASRCLGDYGSGSSWNGGLSYKETLRRGRDGDLARVAPSDKLLSKFESMTGFDTKAFANVAAMSGGVPNVAAYLAGSPLAMRRRQRVEKESAPLNIVVDLVSSSSTTSEQMERRGAAILALLRILSTVRPVSLWLVGNTLPSAADRYITSSAIAFRMDSTPLDLARAAHAICHTGMTRQLIYSAAIAGAKEKGYYSGDYYGMLQWPYNKMGESREMGVDYWRRALGMDEMLFIPGMYADDEFAKPEEWLKGMIDQYGIGKAD